MIETKHFVLRDPLWPQGTQAWSEHSHLLSEVGGLAWQLFKEHHARLSAEQSLVDAEAFVAAAARRGHLIPVTEVQSQWKIKTTHTSDGVLVRREKVSESSEAAP